MTKIHAKKVAPLVLAAIMLVSVCAGSIMTLPKAAAQDAEPGTMQFRYDAQKTGDYSAASDVTPNSELKWSMSVGSSMPSSPTIIDGTLYYSVGTNSDGSMGGFSALDAATKAVKWGYGTSSVTTQEPFAVAVTQGVAYFSHASWYDLSGNYKYSGGASGYGGNPAIANGVAYFTGTPISDQYGGEHLHAVNPATGAVIWESTLKGKFTGPAVARQNHLSCCLIRSTSCSIERIKNTVLEAMMYTKCAPTRRGISAQM